MGEKMYFLFPFLLFNIAFLSNVRYYLAHGHGAWAKQGMGHGPNRAWGMGQTGHGPNRAWAKQGIGHWANRAYLTTLENRYK
jgi:hypothetical protein